MSKKVVAGELRRERNINKKPTEACQYYKGLLWVDGQLRFAMFTTAELDRPLIRAAKQPEDAPRPSVIRQLKSVLKSVFAVAFILSLAASQVGCNKTLEGGASRATDAMDTRGGAIGIAESAGVVKDGTGSMGRKAADFLFGKSLINPIQPEAGWRFENEMRYIGSTPLAPNAEIKAAMFRGYARFVVEYDPFVGVPFTAPINLSLYNEDIKTTSGAVKPQPQFTDSGALAKALEAFVTAVETNEPAVQP